jgi:hypothetical protein
VTGDPRGHDQFRRFTRSMSSDFGRHRPSPRSLAGHLQKLGRNARYHRDRHRLYAARLGSSRPVSLDKLGELKRRREVAESSLRHAKETANKAFRSESAG